MYESRGACINVSRSLSLSLSLRSRRTYGASQPTEPKRSGDEKWTERERGEIVNFEHLFQPPLDIFHQRNSNPSPLTITNG